MQTTLCRRTAGTRSIEGTSFAKEGERLSAHYRCCLQSISATKLMNEINSTRATLSGFAGEPFRIFSPAGVLAGILSVALWPLHLLGAMEFYPGLVHARIYGALIWLVGVLLWAVYLLPKVFVVEKE